jgi:hypothetical protein
MSRDFVTAQEPEVRSQDRSSAGLQQLADFFKLSIYLIFWKIIAKMIRG